MKTFALPPDTRTAGSGNPPQDMNDLVDYASQGGYAYSILNTAFAGGAAIDGTSDSTAAIQACFAAAAAAGQPAFIPAGVTFIVTSLTWVAGLVVQGVYSGGFPAGSVPGQSSVLGRKASSNQDLIVVPDGTNYGAIYDVGLDGNKSQNTAGYGINIQDGAAGQECQIKLIRCYVHDNPYSNVYLGNNRRANHLTDCIFNQSATGDGVTIAGSDNKILMCEIGSNGRAGVCIGTQQTQNWSASGSPFASDVTVVSGCDIFLNQVGVAIAQYAQQAVVVANGIDRNALQGVTVYDGDTHQIMANALHTNGTLTNNTYGHIDVGPGVTQVGINNNTFGPLDSGFTNLPSYAVTMNATATLGCILGTIGVLDSASTTGGLITPQASGTKGWVTVSEAGAVIQGNSGGDILRLLKSGGTVAFKVTANGTPVWTGNQQMSPIAAPGSAAGETTIYADSNGCLHAVNPTGSSGADINLTSGAFLCAPKVYAPASQTTFATTSETFAAVDSGVICTNSFTAPISGTVIVTAYLMAQVSVTGAEVVFCLCATGTTTPVVGTIQQFKIAGVADPAPLALEFYVSGLTAGTAYQLDLVYGVTTSDTLTVYANGLTTTSPTYGSANNGAPVIMKVIGV